MDTLGVATAVAKCVVLYGRGTWSITLREEEFRLAVNIWTLGGRLEKITL
jgi:hypothetical protein